MTVWELHQSGDCYPYTCPVCAWEEDQLAEQDAPPEDE